MINEDAGIVDQHINRSKFVSDVVDHPSYRLGISQISLGGEVAVT
jgi:hypothetical protein